MTEVPFSLTNPFKSALRERRVQIGLWQALANPMTAEICAGSGFDWLLFDGEHGPNTITTLFAQLQAIAPYSVHAVGRPPVGDTHVIKQFLDIGFQTLLIPFVESAEQAERLVRATRYPPEGIRGIGAGLARAARWNGIPGYLDYADDEICLLVQIETAAGLANLDAIARVDGVDGVFIGPADLSAALGHRGRPNDPEMTAIIEDMIGRILAAGKAVGTLATDLAIARRRMDLGCSFVAVGTDVALLTTGASNLAAEAGARKGRSPEGVSTAY
jgi:4-hydroxy-2-oxoheptanedioate aldolase